MPALPGLLRAYYFSRREGRMSRTERLLELMIRLRTRGRFTVQELADE